MRIVSFFEKERITLEKIAISLHDEGEIARSFLNELIEYRIIKPCRSGGGATDEEFATKKLVREYYVDFVGLAEINGIIVRCHPKYFNSLAEAEKQFPLVIKAIEHYNSRVFPLVDVNDIDSEFSESPLSLLSIILQDFLVNGLYINQRFEHLLCGEGEIDWIATVERCDSFIQKSRPHYVDYLTIESQDDDSQFVTRLHRIVVTNCSYLLQETGLGLLLGIETPILSNDSLEDLGSTEEILRQLHKEYLTQFESRKLRLLKLLEAFVRGVSLSDKLFPLKIYGTTNFNMVWELACTSVFGTQLDQDIQTLPIELCSPYKECTKTLRSLIARPEWVDECSFKIIPVSETLTPDFVSIEKKNGKDFFVILDAKYYKIRFCHDRVSGQPGVEDVNKQQLYQLAFEDFIIKHKLEVLNAFVVPSVESHAEIIATASMPILNKIGLKKVKVISFPAAQLLDKFVRNEELKLTMCLPEALWSN